MRKNKAIDSIATLQNDLQVLHSGGVAGVSPAVGVAALRRAQGPLSRSQRRKRGGFLPPSIVKFLSLHLQKRTVTKSFDLDPSTTHLRCFAQDDKDERIS